MRRTILKMMMMVVTWKELEAAAIAMLVRVAALNLADLIRNTFELYALRRKNVIIDIDKGDEQDLVRPMSDANDYDANRVCGICTLDFGFEGGLTMRFIDETEGVSEEAALLLKQKALEGVEIIKYAECGHRFHKSCIQNWTRGGEAGFKACPMCREK